MGEWLAAGALAIGLVGMVAWLLKAPPLPVTRLGLALPAGQQLDGSGGGHILALSPNGAQIAFVASPTAIYLRSMARDDVRAIAGTEGHRSVREPVFSPDGSSIAFYADQTIKRVALEGGIPVTICPAKNPYGISWTADGIVFGHGSEGVMRVAPDGGAPVRIVSVKDDEVAHGPQLLPGGQQVLFTVASGTAADRWDKARIVVQSLQSGERTTVLEGGSDARYLPSGHLVYAVGGRYFVLPFDERRLKVNGDPVLVVEGLRRGAANWTGAANVTISNYGSLVYVPGPISTPETLMDVALVDRRTGKVDVLNLPPRRYASPRVSPDGNRLALAIEDGKEAASGSTSSPGQCRCSGSPSAETTAFRSGRPQPASRFSRIATATSLSFDNQSAGAPNG